MSPSRPHQPTFHGGGWLPLEVLSSIAARLDNPLDLYNASLVNKTWRAAFVNSKSWEHAYWRFYRSRLSSDDAQSRILAYRNAQRRKAMLEWLRSTEASVPSADGHEPVFDGANIRRDDVRELVRGLCHGADLQRVPPHDPLPPESSTIPIATPRFLQDMLSESNDTRPNFYASFTSRMNRDEQLLLELVNNSQLAYGIAQDMQRLLQDYGDNARDLLFAICFGQRVTSDNVEELFMSSSHDASSTSSSSPFHAIDIHCLAAQARPLPHPELVLVLRHRAEQMLGFLQRREAITSLVGLQARSLARGLRTVLTASEVAQRCCTGIEETFEDLALFRSGERMELREYLDLVALFVWAELQAQDRRTVLDGSVYGPRPHQKLLPRGSTRHFAARVVHTLRALGFGPAPEHRQKDMENFFLNVSTLCPAQRLTSGFTVSAIACFVLQRLGVSATPLSTPWKTFCFANEEKNEPNGWTGTANRQWQYFFIDACDVDDQIIAEPDEITRYLTAKWIPLSNCSSLMSPTPPSRVATSTAIGLLSACHPEGGMPIPWQEPQPSFNLGSEENFDVSEDDEPLIALRQYLEGRRRSLPEPLLPATLASSLAALPPIILGASRVARAHRREEAEYAAVWTIAAVAPGEFGGVQGAADMVCATLRPAALAGQYVPDVSLLLQVSPSPSPALTRLKDEVFGADGAISDGVGGWGGGANITKPRAQWTEEQKRRRLDRSRFPRVDYGIGTIFRHQVEGRVCVVVGWDAVGRAAKDLEKGVKPDRCIGAAEPCYHAVDDEGNMLYVAQGNVEPVEIDAFSIISEVVEQLQECAKLRDVGIVGRCFRTMRIVHWRQMSPEEEADMGAGEDIRLAGAGGNVVLVMNEWMEAAWPWG